MKLGIKTTDGVSKLKLKTADGISKAVPCACCGGCDNCGLVAVTGDLLNVLRNATSATCYGYEGFFMAYDWGFDVDWGFAWVSFDYATGCFGGYALGNPDDGYYQNGASIELGECVDICNEINGAGTCSEAPDISINGISFPAYYYYYQTGPLPPQPFFQFS